MTDPCGFIQELEKAELHLHLEGSVEPETLLELDPALSMEEIRAAYQYSDFAGFLKSYIWVSRRLTAPAHYRLVTRRLLARLARQNVRYAEITISVGVILWKEQDFAEIFEAIHEEAYLSPVEVCWVFDAIRQFGPRPAMRVAELAADHRGHKVVAFGIGGDEERGPADWFGEVFRFAKSHGLALVPHAGEMAGAQSIWQAVRHGPDRIGHGIRAIDDPELMKYLREHDIPLEVCISSNVCTGAVPSLHEHPVRKLFDAGVPLTIATDDPPMFHTTLNREYELCALEFGFSNTELKALAQAGFRYALAT